MRVVVTVVIGTESTGVSNYMLEHADRRVYLPQHGFADSLNASVAAALCLHTLLWIYGTRAIGDLSTEGSSEELGALRRSWCEHLARDPEQKERMLAVVGDPEGAAEISLFHDLRRPDQYRQHNGKETQMERRRSHKKREADRLQQGAGSET